MDILVCAVLVSLLLFHSIIIEKNYHNPLSIILIIFSIVTILATLKLYGLRDFDINIYYLILVGCIFLSIGYCIFRFGNYKFTLERRNNYQLETNYILRERGLKYITIAIAIFYSFIAVRVVTYIVSSGMSTAYIRMVFAGGSEEEKIAYIFGSQFIKNVELIVVRPAFFAILVLAVVRFFRLGRVDLQIVGAMLATLFYTMTDFSRIVLIVLLVQILVCGILTKKIKGKQIMKRIKKHVLPISLILIISLYFLSNLRTSESNVKTTGLENLYSYFAIPLPLFAHHKEQLVSSGQHTYGITFIKGYLNFIMTFVGRLGVSFPLFNRSTELINNTQEFIYMFPNRTSNAFTTLFYYFYMDFGNIGVIVESFIYGAILGQTYGKIVKRGKNSDLMMAEYLLLIQSLVKSFTRWEFALMSYSMSFIVVLLFFKRSAQSSIP
ncbi:MAG: oligosaccharide repeat unit polymerase [Ruminococcus albus]|nr:oligosaccharide repeat unit polymerase [Ruminococcus albus]